MAERREPDVELGARVRAKRLRFARAPEVDAKLTGSHHAETSVDRGNLPDRIEPGRTYRHVSLRAELAAWLDEEG
jgi:hypothetical protein